MEEEVGYTSRESAETTVQKIEAAQRKYIDEMREICVSSVQALYHDVLISEVENMRTKLSGDMYGSDSRYGIIDITRLICAEFNVTMDELKIKSRKRKFVMPRQIISWMIKRKAVKNTMSLEDIGVMFSQDHATVLHSVKTIKNLIETEKEFASDMKARCYRLDAIMGIDKEGEVGIVNYINIKNCNVPDIPEEAEY